MMDVGAFVADLLRALADTELFERVDLSTEGSIVEGYAYVRDDLFVRFYFNQCTQTIAFALIEEKQRVWGIDRDNRRGWHLHPVDDPKDHVAIEPLSVSEIVARLRDVLEKAIL
jgi:hypothetical protein